VYEAWFNGAGAGRGEERACGAGTLRVEKVVRWFEELECISEI